MASVFNNPECWSCGAATNDDKICIKCGEHLEDDPEITRELEELFKEYPPFSGPYPDTYSHT